MFLAFSLLWLKICTVPYGRVRVGYPATAPDQSSNPDAIMAPVVTGTLTTKATTNQLKALFSKTFILNHAISERVLDLTGGARNVRYGTGTKEERSRVSIHRNTSNAHYMLQNSNKKRMVD
jgi:hypothetical protein